MAGNQMSSRGRKAWNECYDLLTDHRLTPQSQLLKIEVLNLLEQSMPNESKVEIALMLLVIADSNMRELVDPNER
jgi:hypothetical protein